MEHDLCEITGYDKISFQPNRCVDYEFCSGYCRGGIKNKELGLWCRRGLLANVSVGVSVQLNALVAGNGSYILRPCDHDLHGPTGTILEFEYLTIKLTYVFWGKIDKLIILWFSGAQGEYAGLRAIKAYLESIDQSERTVSISFVFAK